MRRKGLLAFLDDSAILFPHDADACKKKVNLPLRKQQQRRRRQRRSSDDETQQQDNDEEMTPTALSERLALQKPRVVILFFCDAQQAYSIQVRNRILQVLYHNDSGSTSPRRNSLVQIQEQQQSSCEILCCIVSLGGGGGGDSGESSSLCHIISPATREFARSTGMLVTRVASSMALHNIFLPRVQGYPHLMLVRASTGQAFGSFHEELALEWNRPETVRQRWCEGQSGMDCVQQTLSTMLFPTACSIL